MLESIRRAVPRRFLTYDELFTELARFYMAHQPTIRGNLRRLAVETGSVQTDNDSSPPE